MAYKEKQFDKNGASALAKAWGSTNANMVKGGKSKSTAKKSGTKKKK